MSSQFKVEGVPVDVMPFSAAVTAICDTAAGDAPFSVYTINLDHVVKLRTDPAFRAAYNQARFVLADGFPIVVSGRLRGYPVTRIAGSDLIEPLCREAAARGLPVAFYGATFSALSGAARVLYNRIPNLNIVGVYAPGHVDPAASAEPEGLDFIRQSGAKICFFALGAPKQELLAARLTADLPRGMAIVCIGAGVDFLAGVETRAPRALQAVGGEWLWRLAKEPSRLGRRYLDCIRVLPSVLMRP